MDLDLELERLGPAVARPRDPLCLLFDQVQPDITVKQFPQRAFECNFHEPKSDAPMGSQAERKIGCLAAADIKSIGILDEIWVSIGGTDGQENNRMLSDSSSLDFDILAGNAAL